MRWSRPPLGSDADPARAPDLASRFPGWARLIAAQARRMTGLEATVRALGDRVAHDPDLAAALHEVLSSVTAIASASAILVGRDPVEPDWQARFQRNIHEDSRRLAAAAEGLVRWLDTAAAPVGALLPQDEVAAWLDARGHHLAEFEAGTSPATARSGDLPADAPVSPAARALARVHLDRYREDARRLPLSVLTDAVRRVGLDPARLAPEVDVDLACLLRRLATLPREIAGADVGLAVCDASGALLLHREIAGFAVMRGAAGCPLLPLFRALLQPLAPVVARVEMPGRPPRLFRAWAVASPVGRAGFDAPPRVEATMLVLPEAAGGDRGHPEPDAIAAGPGCRVCPRPDCAARREPSILGAAL